MLGLPTGFGAKGNSKLRIIQIRISSHEAQLSKTLFRIKKDGNDLGKYNNEKNLCISHSDTDQQQYHVSHNSAFCLPKKGLKLEKWSSISTLEHSIKEQVS